MGTISPTTPLAALLSAKLARPAATPREPDERTQQAKQVLEDVKRANKAARQAVKTHAKDELQRIREELRLLRKFCTDPKILAREAARLAHRLGRVVKEYADARGEAGDKLDPDTASKDELQRAADELEAQAKDDEEFLRRAGKLLRFMKHVIEKALREAKERETDSDIERTLKGIQAANEAIEKAKPENRGVDLEV